MKFQTIIADPPWPFQDKLPGQGRGAAKHYNSMLEQDIFRFINRDYLADDCRLFLWAVAAMPHEALNVIRAWGFTPKSEIIWVKQTRKGKAWFGMGRTVRNAHERCIIAVRGKPEVKNHSTRSVFYAPVGRHSEKPEAFYDIVEALSPGPYLELFARKPREGWYSVGDELGNGP